MGTVYLARDARLDRPVALKVLPGEFAAVPELRERFLRETRLAAGFSHPNIVPVFAIEDGGDVLAFAMGFVEGESLASRVAREGPLGQRDAVRLLQDVGYALAYAHGRGVVHRDIKPDNIMIERATGRALVMDFGIARAITPVTERPGLTRVGEVVGTPEYMSPEQAMGDAVDGRADLYSLGLVAWYALSGQTAMSGDTTQRILVRQLTERIPPLATVRSDLPSALCDVVDRCCAKEANDRFPNAEALVDALDATQLATSDVPVSVRLLAPDLSATLMRASLTVVLIAYGNYRLVNYGNASVFSFGLIAAAFTWVGAATTVQEVRRLRRAGFTIAELQRQLAVVQAERDEVRAQRRVDPAVVRRRRRRVLAAGVLFASQVYVLVMLLQGRISDGDANIQGRTVIFRFFAALLATALSATVLLSSPFRRPLSERLFSMVWLGRLGARMLTAASWRSGVGQHVTRRPMQPVPVTAAPSATPAPRVQATATTPTVETLAGDVHALRERVQRLEQRR
jgi:hypothetical protein